jgi:hypothetical protein
MEFDHDPALINHFYEGPGEGRLQGFNLTQSERVVYARSLESGHPEMPDVQRAQGGLQAYSKTKNLEWGL